MSKLYLYNAGTHTLHINGFCKDAHGIGLRDFDSEDEAIAEDGRAVGMCKKCMQKRDDILMEYIKNNKK